MEAATQHTLQRADREPGGAQIVRVVHQGDDRFDVVVRGHRITVDQPEEAGGQDTAPTPTELFVSSLAACVGFYARRFLARHHLPEHVEVDCKWWMDKAPSRVGAVEISVSVPYLPPEKLDRFQKAIEHCTIHNTLQRPPHVMITTTTTGAGSEVA
jgi:uncharacterized OsmC-like protein